VSFLARGGPRWFSIPAHRPFLPDLARGLMDALPDGPEALSDATVFVPTRRAARALAEAFLGACGGRAVLLPQIRAVGDLEENEPPFEPGDVALDLPPEIAPYRRRFELARLIAEHDHLFERSIDASGALELADALGAFLDSTQLEEVEAAGRIDALVAGDLARHWQVSAAFLGIALEAWPKRLDELGLIDVSDRRVRLLRTLAERWRRDPPRGVTLAAGSTGTTPANAALLAVIAEAPQGAVVLPGLDMELAQSAWEEVGEQHPQGAMKRLLERAGVARQAVGLWPASGAVTEGRWRRRVINEALRPPQSTADWRVQIDRLREEGAPDGADPIAEGLEGLSVIAARNEEEAADIAALLLRETLETPGKTAALVTPDQALARRVSARLTRWNLTVDSSGGVPLAGRPVGVLTALVALDGADPADPVRLLAILKHPLVRLGLTPEALARARRDLELHGLRGARPDGWDGLEKRLRSRLLPREDGKPAKAGMEERIAEAMGLAARLKAALDLAAEPYTGATATPAEAARGLASALEALASDEAGDPGELWAGADGEAAAQMLSALIADSEGLPEARPRDFASVIATLLDGETVRPPAAPHSRLKILGALEARLVSADRLVLAGLEEGVWPRAAPTDPFLSRPMRAELGLPPPERRTGLSAHDFAQAASAPEVILLHAERREGAPAVQSRWLWRLKTLAGGAGLPLPSRPEIGAWAAALDAPAGFRPADRPRPRPPLEVRPTKLSVTRIETWIRDPYSTYARYILRLTQMERPDEPIEARARGIGIHRALQRFSDLHPEVLPEAAADVLADLIVEDLVSEGMPEARMVRERAVAAHVAPWLIDFERDRRTRGRLVVEQEGVLPVMVDGEVFTVTAKADRIELDDGGYAHVLDYKTGGTPSKKQVMGGLAPQLTLTGAILAGGGFDKLGEKQPGELLYVKIGSGREPTKVITVAAVGESAIAADEALEGLKRRVRKFRRPETEYRAKALPQFLDDMGDYDHLARVWEWHVIGADAAEGGE
jgi:ATP-dependent helicase/nuclease subunit B